MTKPLSLLIATALTLSLTAAAQAASSKAQVSSFQGLKEEVEKIGSPTTTLVVMDDDDTLTMMECQGPKTADGCQYLGGPAWYSWQEDMLKEVESLPKKPRKGAFDDLVAHSTPQLLDVAALLLALNEMPYTEPDVPTVLDTLSKSGVRLLVETARGGANVSATEAQFAKRKVEGSAYASFLDLIATNAPRFGEDGIASLASPFTPCAIPGFRGVTYRQGVMYVAGQNKGVMLRCLLERYRARPGSGMPVEHIVFIDDTQKNVDDVHEVFVKDDRYHVRALHYDAWDDHKAALTKKDPRGAALRKRADDRWRAIQQDLGEQLLKPIVH